MAITSGPLGVASSLGLMLRGFMGQLGDATASGQLIAAEELLLDRSSAATMEPVSHGPPRKR